MELVEVTPMEPHGSPMLVPKAVFAFVHKEEVHQGCGGPKDQLYRAAIVRGPKGSGLHQRTVIA